MSRIGDRVTEGRAGGQRVGLLTEVAAYLGAIFVLAGVAVAVDQAWNRIPAWGHVGIVAGAAGLFLLVGIVMRLVREAAIQRVVDVVWFLSAAGVASAVGLAVHEVYRYTGADTLLAVGTAVTLYAAILWTIRRHALQSLAVFAGLVATVCGTITSVARGPAHALAFGLALWGLGLAWAALARLRYVEPTWFAAPCGALLALVAPSFATADHGWMYAIGLATAAAAMAASVPLRNTLLLGSGALAMFGYVMGAVARYFGDSLGVPATLAVTGLLVIGLAVISARLLRARRPAEPAQQGAAQSRAMGPPAVAEQDAEEHSHEDLPRASERNRRPVSAARD